MADFAAWMDQMSGNAISKRSSLIEAAWNHDDLLATRSDTPETQGDSLVSWISR
jgi:hypothetical protein